MEHTTPKHPSGMEIRYTNRRTNSTHLGQAVSGGGVHLASPIRNQHLVVPATVRAPLHNHRHLLLLQCVSIVLDRLHHAMTDLQCQVRVGQKRENFNVNCYGAYYSTAIVLIDYFLKSQGGSWPTRPTPRSAPDTTHRTAGGNGDCTKID
jgi:hypothetical protein